MAAMHAQTAREHSAGFTLIELLIVVSIVSILASVSMALYRSARVSGGEASAVSTLHAINRAQFAFALACGNQRFAPSLASLTAPMPSTGQGFLSPDLAAEPLVRSGYQFLMAGTPAADASLACTGASPVESYQATADPVEPGLSGIRFFATNTDRVVFVGEGTFTGKMPERGAPEFGSEMK